MKYYSTKVNGTRAAKNASVTLPMTVFITNIDAHFDDKPKYENAAELARGGNWYGVVVLDHAEGEVGEELLAQLDGFQVIFDPQTDEKQREVRKVAAAEGRKVREKSGIGSPVKVVWETADAMFEADPEVTRKDIVEACVAKGVNKSTAGTQYAKWKREHTAD